MSIAWMTRVWRSPAPKGADRMMMLALADNANDEGFCWPSIRTLSRKCAVSERAARRTVHRLRQSGYVAVEQRPGRSTVYHLHAARLTPVVDDTPDADDRGVADDSPTPVADDSPPLSPTTGEPSKNRQTNRQQQAQAGTGGDSAVPNEERTNDDASMLPAASVDERGALVVDLVAQGVDEPVAKRLVAQYAVDHVRAMLRRGAQEAEGPGWYVRAIEDGYRAYTHDGGGLRRYTHAEALAALQRKGIALSPKRPMDYFFAVHHEEDAVWFVPTENFG